MGKITIASALRNIVQMCHIIDTLDSKVSMVTRYGRS